MGFKKLNHSHNNQGSGLYDESFPAPPSKKKLSIISREFTDSERKFLIRYRIFNTVLLIAILLMLVLGWTEYNSRLEMFGVDLDPDNPVLLNGYANLNDNYYCVWHGSPMWNNANQTDVHERCHLLIENDQEHYMERYCGVE